MYNDHGEGIQDKGELHDNKVKYREKIKKVKREIKQAKARRTERAMHYLQQLTDDEYIQVMKDCYVPKEILTKPIKGIIEYIFGNKKCAVVFAESTRRIESQQAK